MIENWCNINGELVPEAEATIPILDRGFLFGDSVYEVIRTRCGSPFAWQEHLERLRVSATGIALPIDLEDREIMRRVVDTIAKARGGREPEPDEDLYVRIIVTRGTGTAPNIDLGYAPGPSTTVLLVRPLPQVSGKPARLALIPRLRVDRRALDPAIKSGNYLNNVLGLAEAKATGATDCLFMNAEGHATEASTANFYLVEGGRVWTPPLRAGLLSGITRRLIAECTRQLDVPFGERDLTEDDIFACDEMFLSSTGRDIAPVTHVGEREVQSGEAGSLTARLMAGFADYCASKVRDVDGPELTRLLA